MANSRLAFLWGKRQVRLGNVSSQRFVLVNGFFSSSFDLVTMNVSFKQSLEVNYVVNNVALKV